MKLPIIDLHCDLLSYLQRDPARTALDKGEIGCALPSLEEGNVRLQVMAIYTATEKGTTRSALQQSLIFKELLTKYADRLALVNDVAALDAVVTSSKVGVVASIENASGFCEEDEPLEDGFKKLEQIISNTGRILYIGLTHHGENRFGGGNTTQVGLKDDGRALLRYISGRKIALDFAHTSDPLAYDLLDYITTNSLDIPILASHSNFRKVWDHPRNLPDDIALEIIKKNGLIGMNFLRAFMNDDRPDALYDHILYGIGLGAKDLICFGADYFYTGSHPDQSRIPFFYKEHENAACYPSLTEEISRRVSAEFAAHISYKNALGFIRKMWS